MQIKLATASAEPRFVIESEFTRPIGYDTDVHDRLIAALKKHQGPILDSYYDAVESCCDSGTIGHELIAGTGWAAGKSSQFGMLFKVCFANSTSVPIDWQLQGKEWTDLIDYAWHSKPIEGVTIQHLRDNKRARTQYWQPLMNRRIPKARKKNPPARKMKSEAQYNKKRKREVVSPPPRSSQTEPEIIEILDDEPSDTRAINRSASRPSTARASTSQASSSRASTSRASAHAARSRGALDFGYDSDGPAHIEGVSVPIIGGNYARSLRKAEKSRSGGRDGDGASGSTVSRRLRKVELDW